HAIWYAPNPPRASTVALPSLMRSLVAGRRLSTDTVSASGDCTRYSTWLVCPAASVTVSRYVPAARSDSPAVVRSFDQIYWYGGFPPFGVASRMALATPAHRIGCTC